MILACALALVPSLRLAVFGDAHFDRGVRTALHGGDPSRLLESTRSIRDSVDISLLNLETPLCAESTAPAKPGGIRLRSDPSAASSLARSGFSVATLANNHVLDRGEAGLRSTLKALSDAGVRTVGASVEGDPCRPLLLGKGADSVAIFAWTQLGGIDRRRVCTELSGVLERIESLGARRIPSVVLAHWGIEGNPRASKLQRDAAGKIAAAGAVAVVGHHAHVIQTDGFSIPSLVGPLPVWYGIGNYVFDQWEPWSKSALAVVLEISGQNLVAQRTIGLLREGPVVRMGR